MKAAILASAPDGAYTLAVKATTANGDKLETTINSVAKVTDAFGKGFARHRHLH